MYEQQENPTPSKIPAIPTNGLERESSVPAAVYEICLPQIQQFEVMLPIALTGEDIEGVHKVRVSSRRLRTCLKFGKPYYQKDMFHQLLDDLKEIARVFGSVRDLDVLKLNMSVFYSSNYGRSEFDQTVWLPIFGNRYTESRDRIKQTAGSNRVINLRQNILELITSEDALGSEIQIGLPTSLKEYLPTQLLSKMDSLILFEFSSDQPPAYTHLHKLRLKAKNFRYLIEFFSPLLEKESSDFLIRSMVGFQDSLGEINDTVIAQNILEPLLAEKLPSPGSKFLENYFQFIQSERQKLIVSFGDIWHNFIETQPVITLETALAPIRSS